MYRVQYSVLSYYPDVYLKSNLAVGVAFETVGDNYLSNEIKFITNRRKLISFDDEIEDLEFINFFLEGIEEEFTNKKQSFSSYIKRFVNNFHFEKVEEKTFQTLRDAKIFVEKTYKYILHLGLEKKERLHEDEKKRYIMDHFKAQDFNVKSSRTVVGKNKFDKFTPDFTVSDSEANVTYYKFLNNNPTAVHNARSYLLFSSMNDSKLVLIVERNMPEIEEHLKNVATKINAPVEFKTELDLIKDESPNLFSYTN